jgi:adenylyl-sulfate kinase
MIESQNTTDGLIVWLHGRSASGKSTLAALLQCHWETVFKHRCILLDGDGFRQTVSSDLGFDLASRSENIRRAALTALLLAGQGFVVVVAFETPTQALRLQARSLAGKVCFVEVALRCSLECCQRRDPKGLYSGAFAGRISALSGLDAPLDHPESADLVVDTERFSPEAGAALIAAFVASKFPL